MKRSVTALAAMLFCLGLAGCGLLGDKADEHKNWTAAEYYKAAKEQFDAHNWEAAAKLYEQLEGKFPYGRFAQQAQIEVAYAYYKQGETAQAISALDKFVKLHPNHPNLDYALYLKALVNFKEDLGILARLVRQDLADRDPKAARESFEGFKDLVARFPQSRYTPDARERMAYLVEALARHEINVARYYLSRGGYLAAANRAQDALKNYSYAGIQRDALEIMIEAYDRMGLTPLRDDSRRVLAQNFPADPMASRGNNRNAPWWKFWSGWL